MRIGGWDTQLAHVGSHPRSSWMPDIADAVLERDCIPESEKPDGNVRTDVELAALDEAALQSGNEAAALAPKPARAVLGHLLVRPWPQVMVHGMTCT